MRSYLFSSQISHASSHLTLLFMDRKVFLPSFHQPSKMRKQTEMLWLETLHTCISWDNATWWHHQLIFLVGQDSWWAHICWVTFSPFCCFYWFPQARKIKPDNKALETVILEAMFPVSCYQRKNSPSWPKITRLWAKKWSGSLWVWLDGRRARAAWNGSLWVRAQRPF